jgi:hypothetical protein
MEKIRLIYVLFGISPGIWNGLRTYTEVPLYRCIDPRFLDLGTSWRWVVSLTSRPFYPRGKCPRYPLDRRFDGPQSHSGRHEEAKNSCPPPGLELRPLGRPTRSQLLNRLCYACSPVKTVLLLLLLLLLVGRCWVPRYLFKFLGISPWYCGHFGLLYKPQMIDEDDFWSNWWNENWQGKPTPAPLWPPQNPTWQTRSRTPDRRGGKPATNRLSYGVAFFSPISSPLTIRRVTVEVFDPASTRAVKTVNVS